MPKAKKSTKSAGHVGQVKKIKKQSRPTVRSTKHSSIKKKAKTKTKRSPQPRRSKVTVDASPLPTPLPVVAPVSMSASAIPSTLPTAAGILTHEAQPETTPYYKELPQRHDRWQLWIAVLAAVTIIFIAWLYLTQRKLSNLPSTISNSIDNAQVDELMNTIKTDYADLQDNIETISNAALQADDTAIPTNTNSVITTTPNSNSELNNLFSDLQ